jgi:16S rRNA (guanine527-N7)-methyltransferase
VEDETAARLEVYFRLLRTWNEKINLTAFRLDQPTDAAFDRLLIEPLAASMHVPVGTRSMIDIGSGGGSPAIPMAIAAPGVRLRMVESKLRKSVFLTEAIRSLGLSDAAILTARFEDLATREDQLGAYDLLTMRAVRGQPQTLQTLQTFLRVRGTMFLFSREPMGIDERGSPVALGRTIPLVPANGARILVLRKD